MNETLAFLARGGPVIYVLGALSLLAVTLIVERLWALQRSRVLPKHFAAVLRRRLDAGELSEAKALCESSSSVLAVVVAAGLARVDRGWSGVREAMQDVGRREAMLLERYTGALGAIANVAPLLGLLGTITGMIQTFQALHVSVTTTGQVEAGTFAAGIWEALITTAAGLTVAIPAFAAYKFLVARVDLLVSELEEEALELVPLIVASQPDASEADA